MVRHENNADECGGIELFQDASLLFDRLVTGRRADDERSKGYYS